MFLAKIAVFSDVHGNLEALNAFYADAKANQASDYWFLGDLFGPGPDVALLWDKLAEIAPSIKVRGNWEDLLINYLKHDLTKVPESIRPIEEYISRRLNDPGRIVENIDKWPLHQEIVINGVKIGLSHHLPTDNGGDQLSIRAAGRQLAALFKADRRDLDLAIYAHIHHPTMRYLDLSCLEAETADYDYAKADERLVLNDGSVGLPFDKPAQNRLEKRAEYLLLKISHSGDVDPQFRRVDYDFKPELLRANKENLPFKEDYCKSFEL